MYHKTSQRVLAGPSFFFKILLHFDTQRLHNYFYFNIVFIFALLQGGWKLKLNNCSKKLKLMFVLNGQKQINLTCRRVPPIK